jgi:PAS domain S-box-containing protein
MQRPPEHPREPERLAALLELDVLDAPSDPDLDALVRLAAQVCGTPVALISLVDRDRQWFAARTGTDLKETPRDYAFCAHAILQDDIMEVADTADDPRFRDNPLVIEDPHIRSYAGFPLQTGEGLNLGTLCVVDNEPRRLTGAQREALRVLGRAATEHLLRRRHAKDREELARSLRELEEERRLYSIAEKALHISEERNRLVISTAAIDAFVEMDASGLIIEWNPRAEEMFGWAEEEVLGKELASVLIPARLRDAHLQGLERYSRTGEERLIGKLVEVPALRRDGTELAVELVVSRSPGAAGDSFHAFIRDITLRREAEAKVLETTARLTALLQNIATGIVLEDPDRKIALANEEFCRIFGIGVPPEMLVGGDCRAAGAEAARLFQDPEGFLARVDEILEAREPVVGELLHLRDGRVFERDYVPVVAEELYRGHLWQYRDVTTRREAELTLLERSMELTRAHAELERASKLKDDFLASMSHELRTPLNQVLGISEALRLGVYGPMDDEQREAVGSIEESGQHLLDLINDILDLSKIEAGYMQLAPEDLDIEQLCHSSLSIVRDAASRKHLTLRCEVEPGAGLLRADPLRAKQALVNLLSNAVKFTPDGGTVALRAAVDRTAMTASFTIRDSGIGIAGDDLPLLFRPFVQLDSRLSREHRGTGLGLSLVSRILELHGGRVAVESEPGRGSSFTVTFPWSPAGTAAEGPQGAGRPMPEAHEAPALAEAPLILVVEDNDLNFRTVQRFLQSRGYAVAGARGAEAIERAEALQPALILMDIQMPGMDGLEATRAIRAARKTSTIPVIALTALVMPGDRERCLAAGANEYLSKPVRLETLAETIERFRRR